MNDEPKVYHLSRPELAALLNEAYVMGTQSGLAAVREFTEALRETVADKRIDLTGIEPRQ